MEEPTGDGVGEKPLTDAYRQLGLFLGEIREYASYMVSAKVDAFKFSLKKAAFLAAIGVVGGIVGVALAATGAVLVLDGLAAGLGILLGARWLGDLIVGAAVIGCIVLGLLFGWGIVKKASLKKVVAKYDERQKRQRERYGRSVAG
jgi:hypothetical protein